VILPDDRFFAPPQVTAMDDQFGTHKITRTPPGSTITAA
jgi:hypothetical protein